jgi:hypothetical protein
MNRGTTEVTWFNSSYSGSHGGRFDPDRFWRSPPRRGPGSSGWLPTRPSEPYIRNPRGAQSRRRLGPHVLHG